MVKLYRDIMETYLSERSLTDWHVQGGTVTHLRSEYELLFFFTVTQFAVSMDCHNLDIEMSYFEILRLKGNLTEITSVWCFPLH